MVKAFAADDGSEEEVLGWWSWDSGGRFCRAEMPYSGEDFGGHSCCVKLDLSVDWSRSATQLSRNYLLRSAGRGMIASADERKVHNLPCTTVYSYLFSSSSALESWRGVARQCLPRIVHLHHVIYCLL